MASSGMEEKKLHYGGKDLILDAKVEGGKNIGHGGFYRDVEGRSYYFVKEPQDKKELFTEFFAGQIIHQLLEHKVLDEKLAPSLIYADLIKLPEGYGLIQPKVKLKPLFKLINEMANRAQEKDRNPLHDMITGRADYERALCSIRHKNLAIFLVISIILGDYSVHSGNMVLLEGDEELYRLSGSYLMIEPPIFSLARIDWGAAFRFFAHTSNSDILWPAEYTGMGVAKLFTKNYLQLYANIPDLFDRDIPREGINLRHQLGEGKEAAIDKLKAIVLMALNRVPLDLLDEGTKTDVAAYMCIQEFESFGLNSSANALIAERIAKIMYERIESVAKLSKEERIKLELDALRKIHAQRAEEMARHVDEQANHFRQRINEIEGGNLKLQEEKQKLQEEKQRLQEEKQKLQEERQKLQEERQKSQEERQKIQEEYRDQLAIMGERQNSSFQQYKQRAQQNAYFSFDLGVCGTLSIFSGLGFSTIGILLYLGRIETTMIIIASEIGLAVITLMAMGCAIYFKNKISETARFFQPVNLSPQVGIDHNVLNP